MKKHRVFQLFILVFCHFAQAFRFHRESDIPVFEFTSPLYNLSVEENSVGTKYARSENSTKIGVPIPEKDATCKFRVAEVVGEKSSLFKAHARQVGDFVFLRIRYKGDNPLNRELKEFYDMLVKATCKRRDSSNLETTARVHLRVIDRNDASPFFLVDDGYEATIEDTIEPFSKVVQVEASDADIGINADIYFSMVNRSHDFFVDPITGWIRTLRPLNAGKYELKVKSEDRASRLFYFDENEVQPSWTADVVINVSETKRKQTKILVEKRKINGMETANRQLAAILTLKDGPPTALVGIEPNPMSDGFELEKETDDVWKLYSVKGRKIPKGTNVTVTVGHDYIPANTRRRDASNATALIVIDHLIEHSIQFHDLKKLVYVVDEMAPIGRIVGRVKAHVANPDDQDLIRYSIKPGNPEKFANSSSKFPLAIGARTGIVRVSSRLNYQVERNFDFVVVAEIKGLKKEATIEGSIEVTDGNDHAPVWSVKWLRQNPVAIGTNLKIGDTILKVDAQDRDEGDNGRIGYKLASETLTPLRIDVDTGEIVLAEKLPKGENVWNAAIWAVDWGSPLPRAAALNLVFYRNGTKMPSKPKPVVIQESANKKAPVFESFPDLVEVSEDAPIGTIIAKLRATDDDAGYNGLVRYVIHDFANFGDELLRINESSGEIWVAGSLENVLKEGQQAADIQVKVAAEDAGNPPKRSEKMLKLKIIDTNNHAPQFDQHWYTTRVGEDAPVGKQLIKIVATDADGGENARIRYGLSSFRDSDDAISIGESTGIVVLKKTLDREQHDVLNFIVSAMDSGNPVRSAFVNLTIHVDDVNDNPPKCVQPITKARIPEDYPHGAFVTCVAANDPDMGQNARIRYSIDSPEPHRFPFRIDHHTGCVFVHAPEQPLDYHRNSFYNISIDVADNGDQVLSTNCELHIELIDIAQNHLAIEFDDVAKEASVYENSPIGTEVIMVEAKEIADEKRKLEDVRYSIIDGDGRPFFNIDDKGIVRTSSVLDREHKSAHWLTIEARDAAIDSGKIRNAHSSRRRAILHVFVRVLDRNDHRPQPRQAVYFASVKENSPANVVIVKVEATDADDVGNDAAPPLQFKIERGDPQSFFRIDLTSGYITTSGSRRLDREKQAEHELWVSICDGGDPQLCSQVAVIVSVEDENDNAPMFTQPILHYNVRAKTAGPLCRIFAVDMDDGDNAKLFYNVTEGDQRFSIDENGVISVSEAIHGDESYALTVQATDRGQPPQYAATRVVLTAIGGAKKAKAKNAAPLIAGKKSDYIIPISDADQVGLTIGKLEATDEDSDELWWSISSGDDNFNFDVRRDNGQILLAKKVETLPRGEIRLNVSVTDGIASDYTTVIIQVSRSATMRPKFSASHYQTDISEKTAVGSQIYTLKAVGEDMGPGTKPLVYSIFSVEDIAMEEKIRVEPSSGNVIVMESLDFEASRQIRATVQVRQANLKNFATLIVNVDDENDNAPRFVQHNMIAYVDEMDPIGSLVAKVTAFDADTGENGIVTYSIVSGNENQLFEIDNINGDVRLAKKVDMDEHVESIIRIRATDGAKYSLSDEMSLHIRNANVTSNLKVKFYKSVVQVIVKDSTPPGTPLTVLSAKHHGAVSFSAKQPCPYFDVHSLSGAVHLAKWLTRERSAKSVNCTVVAETSDGERDETKMVVKIQRTNQHAPIFRKQVYRAQIRENSPIGSPVLLSDNSPLIMSATDADSGPNALIGYKILPPGQAHFVVDLISGAVRVRTPIDFEKTKEWRFHVQAFDMGLPPKSSPMPALVIIAVVDENDEAPIFENSVLRVSPLIVPTANGVPVGHQIAKDKDTVGKIRYFVKDENAKKVFGVNSTSGEIFVRNADYLKEAEYKFDVFASDGIRSTNYQIIVPVRSTRDDSGFRFQFAEYKTSIVENTTYAPGKTLISVNAIGAREGAPVVYSIVNERKEFAIHSGTGVIALTGVPVDREVEDSIRLIVRAKAIDGSESIAQTIVTVNVEDLNDEVPMFLNVPYDVAFSVDSNVGDTVFNVKASDKDSEKNGAVSFTSTNIPNQFTLDKSTGIVKLAKTITYPMVLEFDVEAEDGGKPTLKSKEHVKIRVVDRAQPVFEQQEYSVVLPQKLKKNDVVLKVSAQSNSKDGMIGYRLDDPSKMFAIDWSSGEIRLAKDPRKLKKDVGMTVEAVESTKPKLKAHASVQLKLKPVNKDAPLFSRKEYSSHVPESTAVGEQLMSIYAGEDVSYAIRGDDSSFFSIDMDTGDVRLAKGLDFEVQQRHDLVVIASDRRQVQSEAALTFYVDDVNDEMPKFITPFVSAQVDDAAIPGQFVTILSVVDLDTVSSLAEDEKLLYKIVDGDETLFDINSSNGEVTLARLIENEDVADRNVKNLNVSVTDGIYTSYAQLSVEIKNSGKRQLPPRFEQSQYVASALENTPANKSALLTVFARDGIPPIRYSLGPASHSPTARGSWPVRIDKNTGRIHSSRVLNYHHDRSYQIPLVAEDAAGRRSFATLTLSVIDINDKPPVFVLSSYACSMSETAKEGDTVLMVSAIDDDEHDTIEYSLVDDGDAALFSVHPKQGTVTVAKKLEHKAGRTFPLTIKATDAANPPHHATTTVEINVAPEGTPVPRFSNSHYVFSVSEDEAIGNVIGRVQQVDNDVGEVRFTIAEGVPELPFSVERSTGKIIVRAALDREKTKQWRMAIRADAAGGVHTVTTVTVDVADVNDNAPAFQGDYDRLTISEDAPIGTSVAIFSATDRDEAPSGKIRFTLLEEIAQFVMNPDSGWLTVGSTLDREKQEKYELVARATDEGGLNTDLKFTVLVMDVNDSPPIFDKETYTVELDPSIPLSNSSILDVVITDADLPPNNDAKLYISLGNEEGVFAIDGRSIKVQRPELVALKDSHDLVITAFDGVFARTAKLTINVMKKDAPKCPTEVINVKIPENSKKGTLVVPESNMSTPGAIFALKSETPVPFVINYRNGVIKVKDSIDYEQQEIFEITRSLTVNKKLVCEEKIEVEVLDENDNGPVFVKKKYNVTMKENQKASDDDRQFLVKVEASDVDSVVKYRIINDFGIFRIDDNSGVVTVVKELDRETKEEYVVDIVATDGKFEDKAVIFVSVADLNDNPPVFEKRSYSMKVMESESVGYELAKVRAIDGDVNETVEYRLKTSSRFVQLDRNTGTLTLAQGLDFEEVQKIELVVEAIDSGTPPLVAEAKIEIIVMDENDNAPVFEKLKYVGKVKENAKIGSRVLMVKANDKDSEHFGRVSYSISDQKVPFAIGDDGWIVVNGTIDYETVANYKFKVEGKDGGMPALSSTVAVEIDIDDENDNAPVFDDCNMTAVVQEGAKLGHTVLNMVVRDADGPGNGGPFKFELRGEGSKSFKVDENMHVVTNSKLHHAKKDRFILMAVAKDAKGLATECPLTIWVKEESKHAPTMNMLRIRVNTLQNELAAGIIGRLSAHDQDSGDLLRYGLVDDSVRGPLPTAENPRPIVSSSRPHTFRVDPTSGEIWSDHSITAGLHTFNVTVTDGKFNTLSYVEVIVTSVDPDIIEHAVAIRVRDMTVSEFMAAHEATFRSVLATHLNVQPDSIQLISIQEVDADDKKRARRSTSKDVEILLTAQRGHGRGFVKPDHIYSRLKSEFQSIQDQSVGMRYQLITEMCTTGICQRGECRERIDLLEDKWTRTSTNQVAFVSPHHIRAAQCLCPDGYAGTRCELEINSCSRSPCKDWQMCIPLLDDSERGYECACPLGMEGERCERPACNSYGRCLEEAELSVGGDGYFEMSLSNEIETRMEVEIEIKTTSTNGVVMWAAANSDYHMMAIVDGFVEYTWDAGSGQGVVRSRTTIADGKWHKVSVSRRQRRTRITVDETDVQEAFSPLGSSVINLHRYSQKLIFGAKVEDMSIDGQKSVSHGVSACFKTISVDGRKVPKTRQGLRLYGALPGCTALTSSPCIEMPCGNGGTCVATGRQFTCLCQPRYTGDRCEIDQEPCASHPCPQGIQCIPYSNDFLCKCPDGFTGKHCESRGFNDIDSVCTKDKCGNGKCIPINNPQSTGFICNCTGGTLLTTSCPDTPGLITKVMAILWKIEVAIVVVAVLFLAIVIFCVSILCRSCKRNRDPKYGAHCDVPHMRNTRVLMPVVDPPPLPPRGYRGENANRPTVQVRPFSNAPFHRQNESRSPSVCGSAKGRRNEGMKSSRDDLSDFGAVNRVRQTDRKSERGYNGALTGLRETDDWRASLDENISAAIRTGAEGRFLVGTTELTPVINDDDYMTMKPRKDKTFDPKPPISKLDAELAPKVPAHGSCMEQSVLYDDPVSIDSKSCTIEDIDGDEDEIEEVRIHLS
ncbi:unnamed protein product [Caenorhabditis bovis]|uniref:Uncharacterized protein n=1 Tax=Caenorhabditis bovis TaxID=2654633 RepID=A0A8S1EZR5_9PELO|nr:unnamed protein product [Caenorhabditis bovis]